MPGRHRTIARSGRVGILVAALLTTGAAAAIGLAPHGGPDSTAASGTPPAQKSSMLGGLERVLASSEPDPPADADEPVEDDAAVPADSGHGRRVVFDMSEQRVWIIGRGGTVRTTYLVSGSTSDNLEPGSYRVYSRSERAVGFDYKSTMRYFVRFTRGDNAAIGFHDIPVDHAGRRVQSYDELGTPKSAGCIRQRRSDAREMWRFAQLDTRVVVVD